MDPARFDAITRALGRARSRRGVLQSLGGALGAAGLTLLGRDATLAASCSSDADCIDGRCVQGHCRYGVGGGGRCHEIGQQCAGGQPCCGGLVCTRNAVDGLALCLPSEAKICLAPRALCNRNSECCSNRCNIVSVDPTFARCA